MAKPLPSVATKNKISQRKHKTASKKPKKHFLYSILPKSGYTCVAELHPAKSPDEKPPFHHKWFDKRTEAIRYIKSFESNSIQIFVAQASFKEEGRKFSGRKQENAKKLRNLFMDIDCGEGKSGKKKTYATQIEGKNALLAFCKKTGLPEPVIINSGNGLYAHWPLTTDVKTEIWVVAANKLKKLVKSLEPGLDQDGIITDSARVLRPVGSINRKFTPKMVKLLQDCEPIDFKSFVTLLDNALANLSPESVPPGKEQTHDSNSADLNSASMASLIADKCDVISMFKDKRGDVPEPLWYAVIGLLRHCEEAQEIIHGWSMGYSGYSRAETDRKIAQHKYPPTTCHHFADYHPELCQSCQHFGNIKSPITLGIIKSASKNIPNHVETLNKEYFVSSLRGKTAVFKECFDWQLKRRFLERSSFADIKNRYNNKKIIVGTKKDGNPISCPLGDAWLGHEGRRQYKGIIMSPEGDVADYYNLWQGYDVDPTEGSWELMRKHIRFVICNRDKELYKYVIRWLARLVQEPWTPGEVALVLRGGRGVGKGLLANNMCKIFGQHSCSVRNSKHVTGNFNAHMEDCVLLYVDEAFWAGNKEAEGIIKGIITEPTLFIEPKFLDGKEKRNMLHVIMTSNNEWVVPAGADERRFCVLDVSEHRKGNRPYFKALVNEIQNGGLAAMLYDLKKMDLSNFEVRDVPQTYALIKQKILSLEPVHSWWLQKLRDGILLPGHGWNSSPSQELYDDYVTCAKKQGNSWPGSQTSFGIELHKVLPKEWTLKRRLSSKNSFGKRPNQYKFPSLITCRKHFEIFLGVDALDWE